MGTLRLSAQIISESAHDPKIARLAGGMMNQVDRFVAMTQEILDFSRGVGAVDLKPVELCAAIETTLSFVRDDLENRKIRLTTELGVPTMLRADVEKLSRAFFNIIGNAADAMPGGGDLAVRVFPVDHHVAVEFADTGCGMPPEVRAKMFQPFVTHGKKHGTGLGMAIVKKIVDDHNGSIEVESEPGKGTTVRVLLPAGGD
jgi:signal transduction histidine kinase